MQFAIRHPDRCKALVLVVPATYVPRDASAAPMSAPATTRVLVDTALKSDFLFWATMHAARSSMMRGILATPPELLETASAEERDRIERVMHQILPVAPRRLGLLNDIAVTSSLTRYDLEHVTSPTLLITAADDLFGTLAGARYTADHIPHARLSAYPSGGHLLLGRQAQQAGEIAAFLQTATAADTPSRIPAFETLRPGRRWIGVMR
jgi:2-hydroxy-6-oxonona-2,4-dienedioate hydrolase